MGDLVYVLNRQSCSVVLVPFFFVTFGMIINNSQTRNPWFNLLIQCFFSNLENAGTCIMKLYWLQWLVPLFPSAIKKRFKNSFSAFQYKATQYLNIHNTISHVSFFDLFIYLRTAAHFYQKHKEFCRCSSISARVLIEKRSLRYCIKNSKIMTAFHSRSECCTLWQEKTRFFGRKNFMPVFAFLGK